MSHNKKHERNRGVIAITDRGGIENFLEMYYQYKDAPQTFARAQIHAATKDGRLLSLDEAIRGLEEKSLNYDMLLAWFIEEARA